MMATDFLIQSRLRTAPTLEIQTLWRTPLPTLLNSTVPPFWKMHPLVPKSENSSLPIPILILPSLFLWSMEMVPNTINSLRFTKIKSFALFIPWLRNQCYGLLRTNSRNRSIRCIFGAYFLHLSSQ